MGAFWTAYWWVWLGMLLVGDPIASWLGQHEGAGDGDTATHLIVTHLSIGLRAAVIGWIAWHFLVAHKAS